MSGGRRAWAATPCPARPGSPPSASCAGRGAIRDSSLTAKRSAMACGAGSAGAPLRSGLRRVLADAAITAHVQGDGPLAAVVFTGREVTDYRSAFDSDR